MNRIVYLMTSMLGVIFSGVNQSCRSDEHLPSLYPVESNCFYQEFTYVSSLDQIQAKIVKTEPGGYNILTDQPILIDTTHYQLLNACNLPESLKIAGKPVIVSGKLYKDTRVIPNYLIVGQPFVISKITSL